MKVTLKHYTPLIIAADAIRTAWQSFDKSDTEKMECDGLPTIYRECGPKDRELIDRVGNKFKHSSTLEHLVYHFDIEGVSRALLQELARHRMASPTVKSTRYTLKELKQESSFAEIRLVQGDYDTKQRELSTWVGSTNIVTTYDIDRASKYLVLTGNEYVDTVSCAALEALRQVLQEGVSNDIAKYCLPEAYKTSLKWTVNARSLQNFLALRSNKSALWEIRKMASAIFDAIPDDHKYLFEDSMYKEKETE